MRLTSHQLQILDVLCDGNQDESHCDMDQLLENLATKHRWETTKQSMQFSIRALIKHDLIEKRPTELRRGRNRVILAPTELGKAVMGRI